MGNYWIACRNAKVIIADLESVWIGKYVDDDEPILDAMMAHELYEDDMMALNVIWNENGTVAEIEIIVLPDPFI